MSKTKGIDLEAIGLSELSGAELEAANGGINWQTAGWIAGGAAVGLLCLPLAPIAGVAAGVAFAVEGAFITGSLN